MQTALLALAITVASVGVSSSTEPVPAPTTTTTATMVDGELIEIGTSVEGRTITALRRGDPAGRPVVIIGAIHGDEHDGIAIVERLAAMPVPDGVDLYLIDAMNPDGVAADIRHNANGVDLNRNFPYRWGPIAEPGNWEYAGPGPASEPETQALVAFLGELRPDIVLWYHQDLFMIAPAQGRDGRVRQRYAELVGLPLERPSGGTYTGVAAQWARNELRDNPERPGVAFIVELGATLDDDAVERHADAVVTILAENL